METQSEQTQPETQVEVKAVKAAKTSVTKKEKREISFAGIRWDRMTNKEIAEKVYNDPRNAGAIRTKSFKNFVVTVFLKRKRLAEAGRNVKFGGRVVTNSKGEKVRKDKWVRSPKTIVS